MPYDLLHEHTNLGTLRAWWDLPATAPTEDLQEMLKTVFTSIMTQTREFYDSYDPPCLALSA